MGDADDIILGEFFFLVGVMVAVYSDVDEVFDVGHDQPFKALHDYQG